jgi:hypothetical protein
MSIKDRLSRGDQEMVGWGKGEGTGDEHDQSILYIYMKIT